VVSCHHSAVTATAPAPIAPRIGVGLAFAGRRAAAAAPGAASSRVGVAPTRSV
jgi:hypothetical protein